MKKQHFTRKNFIFLALTFFYVLISVICAMCCDGTNPIMKANNPIQKIGLAFGFPLINGSLGAWLLVICFSIYVVFFTAAFIFEMRTAKYYDGKIWTKKWSLIYLGTFLICNLLFLGIGMCAQYPYNAELIGNSFLFLVQGYVVGLVIFLFLSVIIGGAVMLYVNFKNINKPFKFFDNKEEELKEKARENEEENELEKQGELASSFGEVDPLTASNALNNGFNTVGGSNGTGTNNLDENDDKSLLRDKERVFPGLCMIDLAEQTKNEDVIDTEITLNELCDRFRNYLAKVEKLYFSIDTIRAFISGLAASRLVILEGLSGTGKSSLARYFSEFINEKSYFEAVQATWRDRTSLLGYYNDFSRTYNETEFLKRLYEATYKENRINIMVLDELNISRIEYYFADFLSILEYPVDEWKLKIMQLPYDFEGPEHLEDGTLKISKTTWFIGTANKDDSTYTITDKVYDRAITISFDDQNTPFSVKGESDKINLSFNKLITLYDEAYETEEYRLNKEDLDKFSKVTKFTYDTFDLTFGNRIMHQIEILVPVYVSCGGTKEEALDFMFSRKVLSKLEGRFEDYIKDGLINLMNLLDKTYGKNEFSLTRDIANKLIKKL